jgi:hypothetical protein
MTRLVILNLVAGLAACSSSSPKGIDLIEGYCTANEADRCYFAGAPTDGF